MKYALSLALCAALVGCGDERTDVIRSAVTATGAHAGTPVLVTDGYGVVAPGQLLTGSIGDDDVAAVWQHPEYWYTWVTEDLDYAPGGGNNTYREVVLPAAVLTNAPAPEAVIESPTDDADIGADADSVRIGTSATFSGDNVTLELPPVSGLVDGHRVRLSDPHEQLGGLLPTLALVLTTDDSAIVRYGASDGASVTIIQPGFAADVELVRGAQGDGSDSVWIVVGDGGGLL